ncbi:hypothetical protein [Aliiglaciecola litoralis]|uniref:Class IIb bacteriocin, lactobin A/cerein 7B family n=1 Tax=Aliiglaciecola litoralis TaxID=582857 RepID=A0ABP3WQ72_9ALTE
MKTLNKNEVKGVNGGLAGAVIVVVAWYYFGGGREVIEEALAE